jgi:hypothetical protein
MESYLTIKQAGNYEIDIKNHNLFAILHELKAKKKLKNLLPKSKRNILLPHTIVMPMF